MAERVLAMLSLFSFRRQRNRRKGKKQISVVNKELAMVIVTVLYLSTSNDWARSGYLYLPAYS